MMLPLTTVFSLLFILAPRNINCECGILEGSLDYVYEIFRSSVVEDSSCCEVCQLIEACNAWTRCTSEEGCILTGKTLAHDECAFYFSGEMAAGGSPKVINSSIVGVGQFEHGYVLLQMMKTGSIIFMQSLGASATQNVQQTSDATTFASFTTATNLDEELKSDLANPDFSGIICVPTDAAFDQFFDNTGISVSSLENDTDALNTLMKQNILPGDPCVVREPGETCEVFTLLPGENATQTATEDGGIEIQTSAMEQPANKLTHTDLSANLTAWTIDQVLLPPRFVVNLEVLGRTMEEFATSQPGTTILIEILSHQNFPTDLKTKITTQFQVGRFYAPVDNVFEQILARQQVTLQEFLLDQDLINEVFQVLVSLDVGDGIGYGVQQFLSQDIYVSVKAQLGVSTSVWIVAGI
eukprot:TRINITY_DN1163_c0_g1_i1.p1 TRINITY_DN1163_c0_g1~~TRINITY_DN1163_c0_g1_i1.p1  ORF type:complete len:411 (-),score=38.97 TRINITY_DN1163_c0_g1_i1:163-1395(-)